MTIAMIQNVPILGELDNISTILGFAEVRLDDDGELVIIESGCGATSQTGNAISVEIPPAIPQSVTPTATPLTVWEEDGVIHWSRPLFVIPIGIRLEDPINDALPTDPNDGRIWDQDGDGEPGVTVKVSGFAEGDIYVIQKQISSEHGTIDADGNLAGFVVDNSEQVVIGSTNPLLSQQVESRPNPDASLSTLASVALDGPQDCEWLTANAAELFPPSDD